MRDDAAPLTPLDPAQLAVLRVRAFIAAAMLLVPLLILESAGPIPALPFGLLTAAAAILLGVYALRMPRRRYASWGYRMAEDELHIQHGIWTRTRTIVPFGRVQHIDVSQGPIERRYGVGTLVLHTAGTSASAVDLPGLRFDEAGRMRDLIRGKIRQDLL